MPSSSQARPSLIFGNCACVDIIISRRDANSIRLVNDPLQRFPAEVQISHQGLQPAVLLSQIFDALEIVRKRPAVTVLRHPPFLS